MITRSSLPYLLAALSLGPAGFAADASANIKGFAPVSVSAANYRDTPREELVRSVEFQNAAVNPDAPTLKPLAKPQYYVFIPGEIFESDLKYDQVTEILTAALAKKGYINAADPLGIIREPDKVTLMLRVNYGTLPWRLPTVRSKDLTWYDGMIARPRGIGLHTLGGERSWDQRAGGNDDALDALAKNDANPNGGGFSSSASASKGGGGGGSSGGGSAAATVTPGLGANVAGGLTEYGSTRDFHVIVVDAFDYQELKKRGKSAARLWTTFVSAPKQGKQKFSEIAETLARNAIPYFGETSNGLQVYSDVRAEVKIGELVEVKDEPADKK
jgi:hypothetical protein